MRYAPEKTLLPTALLLALCAGPALADGPEYEIRFYLQPDSTGQNTLNKSVEIDDDGELTIEESRAEGSNRYIERDATPEEIDLIARIVAERASGFSPEYADRPDYPRVEVGLEFDGGAVSIEVEEHYPKGAVPDLFRELQAVFFEDIFE